MAVRETIALLGISALGGVWAVAWGTKRIERPRRVAMLDARTQMQVHLDALRARTGLLSRRPDLVAEARELLDEVVEQEILIDAVLARAAALDDVHGLWDEVNEAFLRIEEAGEIVGVPLPAHRPFAGLCALDPQHGPAVPDALIDGRAVCAGCAESAAGGSRLPVRQVTENGRPVAFDVARARSQEAGGTAVD